MASQCKGKPFYDVRLSNAATNQFFRKRDLQIFVDVVKYSDFNRVG